MLAAVEAGCEVVEYTPAEIKRAVVGYGRAEKHQVQQMVKLLLGLRPRRRRRTTPPTRWPSRSVICIPWHLPGSEPESTDDPDSRIPIAQDAPQPGASTVRPPLG